MQIIFSSGTKFLWLAQYVNEFLVLHKKFRPAHNILGPVKEQGISDHLEIVGQVQQCRTFFRFGKEENALDPHMIDQLEIASFTMKRSSRTPIWFAYDFTNEVERKFRIAVTSVTQKNVLCLVRFSAWQTLLSCRIFVKTHRFWQFQNICCIELLEVKRIYQRPTYSGEYH